MSSARRAAIYVRISDDRAGDAAGVGRQEADCRDLAARQGWDVADIYTENDTSAFKRRTVRLPDGSTGLRVVRPVFRRLLDDLATGAVTALIGYDLDRIARDPRDLEDLIDVVETGKIPTRTVTGGTDLSTDSGITMARIMVGIANKSSRDTARRVTRKQQDMAKAGDYAGGGIRSYGYERDGITVNVHEAAVVRSMADAVIHGDSLNEIARTLNTAAEPTVRGGAWLPRSVHSVVTKPRNIGKRVYQGEVIGDATWPPILDVETWERVCLALAGRGKGSTNTLQRWLTGVLTCSLCGHELVGSVAKGGHRYWCATPRGGCGKITVSAARIEDYVEQLILGYLTRPDVLRELSAVASSDNVDRARTEAADDEAQLAELARLWAAKTVSTPEYLAARKDIEARLSQWHDIIRAATPGSVRSLLTADDIPARWASYSPADRREVARAVFPDGVRVCPATATGQFDPARVLPVGWTA